MNTNTPFFATFEKAQGPFHKQASFRINSQNGIMHDYPIKSASKSLFLVLGVGSVVHRVWTQANNSFGCGVDRKIPTSEPSSQSATASRFEFASSFSPRLSSGGTAMTIVSGSVPSPESTGRRSTSKKHRHSLPRPEFENVSAKANRQFDAYNLAIHQDIRNAKTGEFILKAPQTMKLPETTRLSARIALPDDSGSLPKTNCEETLSGIGQVQSQPIKVTSAMDVTLIPEEPGSFQVKNTKDSGDLIHLAPGGYADWVWDVTATESGNEDFADGRLHGLQYRVPCRTEIREKLDEIHQRHSPSSRTRR